jgi:hypothetical protein
MAATDVSICSNALLMLGDASIADFNEDSDRANLASNLFPQVRDAVLRSHPWNCAVKRVILAPETTVPDFDYSAQFAVPDDWMRTLQVGERGAEIDFRQEGRKFLADTDTFRLRYVWRNEVVASWDPMLVHAVSLMMKAAFAYPITKSTSLATASLTDALNYLKTCRAIDGQDEPPDTLGQFMLLSARGSDPSSWSWR